MLMSDSDATTVTAMTAAVASSNRNWKGLKRRTR